MKTQKQALKATRAHLIRAMQTTSPVQRMESVQAALHCTDPGDIMPIDIRQLNSFKTGFLDRWRGVKSNTILDEETTSYIISQFIDHIKERTK